MFSVFYYLDKSSDCTSRIFQQTKIGIEQGDECLQNASQIK